MCHFLPGMARNLKLAGSSPQIQELCSSSQTKHSWISYGQSHSCSVCKSAACPTSKSRCSGVTQRLCPHPKTLCILPSLVSLLTPQTYSTSRQILASGTLDLETSRFILTNLTLHNGGPWRPPPDGSPWAFLGLTCLPVKRHVAIQIFAPEPELVLHLLGAEKPSPELPC